MTRSPTEEPVTAGPARDDPAGQVEPGGDAATAQRAEQPPPTQQPEVGAVDARRGHSLVVAARVTPRVIDRLGAARALALGAAVIGLELPALARVREDAGYPADVLGPYSLVGIGVGCWCCARPAERTATAV